MLNTDIPLTAVSMVLPHLDKFDGEVIILAHMGIDTEINGYVTPRGEKLRAFLAAYQKKTLFADDELELSVDYANSKGKILSYQFGHIHEHLDIYGEDIDLWQLSTTTAAYNPCFDVMLVSSDEIKRFNVGTFEDSEIKVK